LLYQLSYLGNIERAGLPAELRWRRKGRDTKILSLTFEAFISG